MHSLENSLENSLETIILPDTTGSEALHPLRFTSRDRT